MTAAPDTPPFLPKSKSKSGKHAPTLDDVDVIALSVEAVLSSWDSPSRIVHDFGAQLLVRPGYAVASVEHLRRRPFLPMSRATARALACDLARRLRTRPVIGAWKDARDRILPRLVLEIDYVMAELQRARHDLAPRRLLTLPATEDLRLEYVWEEEHGEVCLVEGDLVRWGVAASEVQAAARQNLARRTSGPLPWEAVADVPGVLRSPWRDGFDATRVILGDGLEGASRVPVTTLAPAADAVYRVDGEDVEALDALGWHAMHHMDSQGTYFAWMRPVRVDGGSPVHWLPQRGHAARDALALCASHHGEIVYEAHRPWLQKHLDRWDPGRRVCSVQGSAGFDSDFALVAVWKDGTPVSVGVADEVNFYSGHVQMAAAPFERVCEVLGADFVPRPGYPPRYDAEGFPTPERLARLGGSRALGG